MYILDTDICVFWLKGNRSIEMIIEKQGIENVFVTIITACELYFGAYNSQKKDDNMSALDDLFSMIGIIQTTSEVARIFGETKTRLKKFGKLINDADLLIASIVIANNGILVTNNTTHFERIPDLKLENWLS
jgi:tRNA(fMet)-specific endonuclease VapC